MAYTALIEMRENLQAWFKSVDMGPKTPEEVIVIEGEKVDLITAVKHFIHERCVGLRFDSEIEKAEIKSNVLLGKSSVDGQIPYNMQMDIDRLCFARAMERFWKSGSREDAFDVYFCYMEMFGDGYSGSRRMIELLSEFESTASTMLMSHRDHYSHSVYVFLLGLAMFDSISVVRNEYKKFYDIDDDCKAAHHFLRFWGMTALFHDIGYPFEISFEQVKSYFMQRNKEGDKAKCTDTLPFVCYGHVDEYVKLKDNTRSKLKEWYGMDFESIEDWMAYTITNIIKSSNCQRIERKSFRDVKSVLEEIARPTQYKKFMDHAYFSSIILFKEMEMCGNANFLKREHLDAIIAIALHNALYKRNLTDDGSLMFDDHAFMLEWHPLAYLLQLADELQCWDRVSYGRNTRNELHAMSCNLEFDDNGIYAEYVYDGAENKKILDYWTKYEAYLESSSTVKKPKLKKYSDMLHDNPFAKEIGLIVGLSNLGCCKGKIRLEVSTKVDSVDYSKKKVSLSSSNFIHIYDFAAALNAQYNKHFVNGKEILEDFERLSLEYKLSNIGQAKNFAKALEKIGCFYTDRPVAYEMVTDFSQKELLSLGECEHKRWENEKREMCWLNAGGLTDRLKENNNQLRELARMHYDLDVRYEDLSDVEKLKDTTQLNTMMLKLFEFDGIRVYRYN